MHQDKITGAFHFEGGEDDDALRWMWTCLRDLSWRGMIETILRIIFKRPPNFVEYKNPEYYKEQSLIELHRLAGTPLYKHCRKHLVVWDIVKGQTHDCKEGALVRDKNGKPIASLGTG